MQEKEKPAPRGNTSGQTKGSELVNTSPPSPYYPATSGKSIRILDDSSNERGVYVRSIPREALELHNRGMVVVPCFVDKRPMIRWAEYQTRRPSEKEFESWARMKPASWAVITGKISGVVVLDFDGPIGVKTLRSLGLKPHIKTPSGGYHVYVELPDNLTVRTTNAKSDRLLGELYKGTDVRANGGYAIVCGRNLKGEYRRLRPIEPEPWESLPVEFREYLTGNPRPAKANRLLREALSKASPGCRNQVGFELACKLRDSDLPYEIARETMRKYAEGVPQSEDYYTLDEAEASLNQAYKREPRRRNSAKARESQGSEAKLDGFSLTDLGNAERLIERHGENLRFDVDAGKWLIWNGERWKYDTTSEVDRLAHSVIRELNQLLPSLDRYAADALHAHIKRSESAHRLAAMIDLATKLHGVSVRAFELDANPWILNCLNGTLDLRTGELREQKREDLITKICPVEYDPNAEAPRWNKFLQEVFKDDEELIAFVKRVIGYALTGNTDEQCIFLLAGKGANGKSTFVETLRRVLGDYAGDTPFSTFVERKDSNTSDLAGLVGKRFVTASEGEVSQTFNEGLLKKVTGGDSVTCRFLYREYFTYAPTYKLLFCTNEVPHIRSQNYAMRRRVKVIPFRQRFYEAFEGKGPVRDNKLLEKLVAEKSGILKWAVEGCLDWQKPEGLNPPPIVMQEVNRLFESQDVMGEFIDSECLLDPKAEVEVDKLWKHYLRWCEEHNIRPAFHNSNWFSRNLMQRDGIDGRKGSKGKRLLVGITIKS